MQVIIKETSEVASRLAARVVAELIQRQPYAVLGLAAGSTQLRLYEELGRMHREEGLDFSRITTFNLDEYVGVARDHPTSFYAFMHQHLFNQINIPAEHIHIPDGLSQDTLLECERYERSIKSVGGIDLQILGIGRNGHIAFNEPSSSLASRTRVTRLSRRTIQDNARFFDSEDSVPTHSVTMGIGTILEARHCLLMAFGEDKKEAVTRAVEGPVSASLPASALQLHPQVKIFLDEKAASGLENADYYRWIADGI